MDFVYILSGLLVAAHLLLTYGTSRKAAAIQEVISNRHDVEKMWCFPELLHTNGDLKTSAFKAFMPTSTLLTAGFIFTLSFGISIQLPAIGEMAGSGMLIAIYWIVATVFCYIETHGKLIDQLNILGRTEGVNRKLWLCHRNQTLIITWSPIACLALFVYLSKFVLVSS